MAYGDFKSLQQIQDLVDLTIVSKQPLFREVPTIAVSQELQDLLTDNVPLALNINTEKAYSKFIGDVEKILGILREFLTNRG